MWELIYCSRTLMRPSATSAVLISQNDWVLSLFEPDFLALCVLPHIFSIKMFFSAKVKENEFLVTSGL